MNPYTSTWTGATEGQKFHLVLLDNGRTATLADPHGQAALRCIRCSACLNVCPVYERAGGHAYGSVYPGPIGAVLSPQLTGVDASATSDIELDRVEGVHGPRTLDIALVKDRSNTYTSSHAHNTG